MNYKIVVITRTIFPCSSRISITSRISINTRFSSFANGSFISRSPKRSCWTNNGFSCWSPFSFLSSFSLWSSHTVSTILSSITSWACNPFLSCRAALSSLSRITCRTICTSITIIPIFTWRTRTSIGSIWTGGSSGTSLSGCTVFTSRPSYPPVTSRTYKYAIKLADLLNMHLKFYLIIIIKNKVNISVF